MSLNPQTLKTEIALIVDAVKDNMADKSKANTEAATAVEGIRKLAGEVAAEMPAKRDEVAKLLHVALIAAGVKKGTADPYRTAFTGYVTAVTEGQPIDTGYGSKSDKPMTAPAAREFNLPKAERDERAKIAELRTKIGAAVRRATTTAMLADVLEMVESIVPAADAGDAATVTTIDPENLLADIFGEAREAA